MCTKNSAKIFFDQQYGNAKWKSYDGVIKRLRCPKEEQYTHLLPTEHVICDTPIFACKFAQQKNNETLLALANEDGKLAIHDTSKKEERFGIRAHNNAIFDLAWMFQNMKIVTASGDHTAKLFDVANADIREVKTFYGHSRSVKTIAFRKEDPSVFATGGRDGNIIIWDTRTEVTSFMGKADRTIINSHNIKSTPSKPRKRCLCLSPSTGSGAKSVTGLVFQDDFSLISCGAGDGLIKIWDLRKNYMFSKHQPVPKQRIPYAGTTTKNGFSSLIIDRECNKLYANCLDNTIYCYNLGTYNPEPIRRYFGHQNSTFYIKSALSKNGLYLISGSSDENAYIWNTNYSQPLAKLVGHNAEVTCVAWCEEEELTLVTCSDDMSHKIWRVGTEDLPENWEFIGKGNAEILPIKEVPNIQKRPNDAILIPAKKLVIPCTSCDSPSTSQFCQNCTNSSKRKCDAEEISIGSKRPRRLFDNLSARNNEQSPTINLPNFVIDGVAPHLHFSPPKPKSQDWLTRMRIERQFRKDILDIANPPSPKVLKLDLTPKKSSPSISTTQSPILRFFKVKCDGHSCSKATSASNVVMQSPQSSQ